MESGKVIAVTRGIPSTFHRAIVRLPPASPIDVELARAQHAAYVRALRSTGVEVVELPPDDRHPDCCFVEDCAVVHQGVALLGRAGEPSRRGERKAVAEALREHVRVEPMDPPATLEGGDCLRIDRRLYVGRGDRTNGEGARRARQVFGPLGLEVVEVPLPGLLHLKCVSSYLGKGVLLLVDGALGPGTFEGALPILVPPAEAHAANGLAIGDSVFVPSDCPVTIRSIEAAGFRVLPLDTSEIRKADGALTCLSILV